MNYLLDTNICVLLIRKKSPHVLERIQRHPFSTIGVSTLTIAELQYGVAKSSNASQNQEALDGFLIPFTLVVFDEFAAISYGEIRVHLERHGTPIDAIDLLLAAQALSNQLILVTNNVREFGRVPGLRIEDWTLPHLSDPA